MVGLARFQLVAYGIVLVAAYNMILNLHRKIARHALDLELRVQARTAELRRWEALGLSDSVTLVADREAASVHCGADMLEPIPLAVSRETAVRLAVIDRTALEAPLPLDDLKKQLKVPVSATIPAAGAAIALSNAARTPLVLLYPGVVYSLSHFELAEQLLPPTSAHRPNGPGTLLSHKISWHNIPETIYG